MVRRGARAAAGRRRAADAAPRVALARRAPARARHDLRSSPVSTRCSSPVGLLVAFGAAQSRTRCCSRCRCRPVRPVRPRAGGADRRRARALPGLPRHRPAPRRRHRGRRPVHGRPHQGRRRAHPAGRRRARRRRRDLPRGRVRRAAPRRRQDPHPERDHQQAREARRRRVGDHEDPHRRGRRRCSSASGHARPHRRRRPRLARALGRRRLPDGSRARNPPGVPDRARLRRLRRDDHRPLLPACPAGGRRLAELQRCAALSSTRRSSLRSSPGRRPAQPAWELTLGSGPSRPCSRLCRPPSV